MWKKNLSVFYSLVPVQQNPVKVQMLAFQLQLWPNAPAGEVDDDELWIVLDIANNAVLHLSQFCWVGPHCQLLAGRENIYMFQCYWILLMSGETSVNRQCYDTCFWSGLRVMVGGSSRYVVAWVSCWKRNWTSASRPDVLWITSLSVFSGYLVSLYLHKHRHMWICKYWGIDWYKHKVIHCHYSASHLSLVLPQSNGPNSKYPGLIT